MAKFVSFNLFRIFHLDSMSPTVKERMRSNFQGNFGTGEYKSHFTNIEGSIHYRTLVTGDYDLYDEFVKSTNQHNHSIETFKDLQRTVDLDKIGKIKVRKYLTHPGLFVLDGNHRLAVLKHKGLFSEGVPLDILDIVYDDYTKRDFGDALKETTTGSNVKGWNNSRAPFGYHSFSISNIQFVGQRNPKMRLEKIRAHLNLVGKRVLDLGCNTGGMLLHAPYIQKGVGIDLDEKCIRVANLFKDRLFHMCDYSFEVGDVNVFSIDDFCRTRFTPDVVFLLSLGSWIINWPMIYAECYSKVPTIVFETNNDAEGTPQLELFERLGAKITLISASSDDDCTGNVGRKTYLIINRSIS